MRLTRSRIETGDVNKVLDDVVEQVLYLYIEFTDDLDISIREKLLTKTINLILRNYYFKKNSFYVISTI